jgi:hypothetical protein
MWLQDGLLRNRARDKSGSANGGNIKAYFMPTNTMHNQSPEQSEYAATI